MKNIFKIVWYLFEWREEGASTFQILEKEILSLQRRTTFLIYLMLLFLLHLGAMSFFEKPKRNTQEGLLLIIPFIWDSKNLLMLCEEVRDISFSFLVHSLDRVVKILSILCVLNEFGNILIPSFFKTPLILLSKCRKRFFPSIMKCASNLEELLKKHLYASRLGAYSSRSIIGMNGSKISHTHRRAIGNMLDRKRHRFYF